VGGHRQQPALGVCGVGGGGHTYLEAVCPDGNMHLVSQLPLIFVYEIKKIERAYIFILAGWLYMRLAR